MKTLNKYDDKLKDSVLIGHSLGAPFILNVLNLKNVEVKAAFLVSAFASHLDVREPGVNDFSERNFDWEKIKSRCGSFCIIHSDNDPYVPLEEAESLAGKLGEEVIVVKNGKHFQSGNGYGKFRFLLEKINDALK